MRVFVDDQERARTFYTTVLGFLTRRDFPVGQFRSGTPGSSRELA
jgi:hypothetical protein